MLLLSFQQEEEEEEEQQQQQLVLSIPQFFSKIPNFQRKKTNKTNFIALIKVLTFLLSLYLFCFLKNQTPSSAKPFSRAQNTEPFVVPYVVFSLNTSLHFRLLTALSVSRSVFNFGFFFSKQNKIEF